MVFTANHGADHHVLARFGGGGEPELLIARLEQKVPSFHLGSIFGSQQGEAMDRSIPVPRFAAASGHSEKHFLARLHGDLRSTLSGYLIAAVAVGQQLDD